MAGVDDRNWGLWGLVVSSFLAFLGAVSLVGTIGTMRLSPIDDHLKTLDLSIADTNLKMTPLLTLYAQHASDVAAAAAQHTNDLSSFAAMQKQLEAKVDTRLFDVAVATTETRFNQGKADTLRTMDELTHQIHALEAEIVTRAEHDQQNSALADRLTSLERRIDALTLVVQGQSTNVTKSPNVGK